jgi:taurine dioxygenase
VAVHGVDVAAGVDDETFRALAQALYDKRVIVIKSQDCGKDAYLAFGRQWGAPIPHVVDTARMPDFPEMMALGNTTEWAKDDISRNAAAFWHTDQSYDADPATSTMLYARNMPDVGGQTRVADMKAAYDDLDEETRARLDALVARHFYGATSGQDGELGIARVTARQAAEVPPVPHRLVRRHTVTGEKALYAVAGTAYGIEGMANAAALALIAELKAHVTQGKYVYEHAYEVGDIAMWDTQMTLHAATPIGLPDGPGSERLVWRISVRGKPPIFQ